MEVKYRYKKTFKYFHPEWSKDGNTWEGFTVEKLEQLQIKPLADKIAEYEGCKSICTFKDVHELYFLTEVGVTAFLGGTKVAYKQDVIEFEFIN